MSHPQKVDDSLNALGECLRQQLSIKDKVMQRLAEADPAVIGRFPRWDRSRSFKAAFGLAACVGLIVAVTLMWGTSAQQAFANAISRVQKAHTFSCRVVVESRQPGREGVSFAYITMFKEPDLWRHEILEETAAPETRGRVTIADYGKQVRLIYEPARKTAHLENLLQYYEVDPATGQTRRNQLHTDSRDDLLSITAAAVEDLGTVQLEGQTVRLLRSQNGQRVTRAWIQPQTGLPVQIEIDKPEHRIRFSEIQIDAELSDDLFSLQPPAGYTLTNQLQDLLPEDRDAKITAKIIRLAMLCCTYFSNNNQWPESLSDLVDKGITDAALKTLLADPATPDGPPVIVYRKPRPGRDWGKEIMLYEAFDQWPNRFIRVGFADGHCEAVDTQARFEEWMR